MKNRIHILEPEVANKIAAGEVVQRPASVVKELVENALDARAQHIEVIVREAGRSLVQVTDDGEGMTEEDARLAFRRHATSKVTTAEDLESIRTLGFRGEALASIAAVAQVEMKTRLHGDEIGTLVRVEGDKLKERSKTAAEGGTTVVVRNLFFNTPARRNFLKSRQSELKNITDVVLRSAIAYPTVEWKFVSDDESLLDLRPAEPLKRLTDIFGERHASALLVVREANELITVEGYIGKPDFARRSRADQYVYLNKRYIQSKMINHAVFQAYEHLLEKGAFPFFILHLFVDPHRVDVNVHPSKLEVKFEQESNVYRLVLSTIRKTLAANDLVPTISFTEGVAIPATEGKFQIDRQPWSQAPTARGTVPGSNTPVFVLQPEVGTPDLRRDHAPLVIELDDMFARPTPASARPMQTAPTGTDAQREVVRQFRHVPDETPKPPTEGRAIWQVHNKYIVSQIRSGLMVVDQHAAHERILYERVVNGFENNIPPTQQLLFPHTVELSSSDYALAKELLPGLVRLGFDLKLFGKNTVVIEGIPSDVRVGSEKAILQDVLDEYHNNEHASAIDAKDNLAKSYACRAAIKAGDKLSPSEMVSLIDHLFLTQMPYACPHGRPVVLRISIEELDRKFGRT